MHHPDKVATLGADDAYFVQLKLAQDTLLKPVQRYAYDRFGPEAVAWEHCSSIRDYISAGLMSYVPAYLGSTILMIILGVTGYLRWGRFVCNLSSLMNETDHPKWRYLAAAALVLLEVFTLTRPHPLLLVKIINPILTTISSHPPLLPFQLLILARKIILTIFIALAQLGPYFRPLQIVLPPKTIDLVRLARLEHVSRTNEAEATRLLNLDMAPYAGDKRTTKDLKEHMTEWLVQTTIRADPQVREAIGQSLRKRQPR